MKSNRENQFLTIGSKEISSVKKGISLRRLLIIPFVLQIFTAVGITGYLSFRNGQKAINNLATALQEEVSDRISLHLDNYITTAVAINKMNAETVKLGLLDLRDYKKSGLYQWKQLQIVKNIGYISYALPTGEYSGAGRWLEDDNLTIDELSADTNWESHIMALISIGFRHLCQAVRETPVKVRRVNEPRIPSPNRRGVSKTSLSICDYLTDTTVVFFSSKCHYRKISSLGKRR